MVAKKTNIECVIFSGATAAAIKSAFDAWNKPNGNDQVKVMIVSIAMFANTDLIVFYYALQ